METSAVNLLSHRLETLLEDGEFVLCRSGLPIDTTVPVPSALVVMPRSEHPRSQVVRMLEHDYSLRDALDPVRTVRSVALTTHEGRAALVLEDPGGEGKYLIAAVDYVQDGQWYDPEFLSDLRPRAERLSLAEAESKRIDLTVKK
jgi:hypothetical protein